MIKDRTGGVGSILYTLFHIVDVDYSWMRGIQGKEDVVFQFADYNTLEKMKSLSHKLRTEIVEIINNDLGKLKERLIHVSWDEENYTSDEIIHHIIIHEILHIGQLSVWARELELRPVSANFIGRELTRDQGVY